MAGKPRGTMYPEYVQSRITAEMKRGMIHEAAQRGCSLRDIARDALGAYLKGEIEEAERIELTENLKFSFTADMKAQAVRAAGKLDISMSELVRRAIERYLEEVKA